MPVAVFLAGQVADSIASGLADTNKVFVTEDDIYDYMNDAIITASIFTKSIDTKLYTFLTGAGVDTYNLPRDVILGDVNISVFFDGKPLAKGQFAEQKITATTPGKPLVFFIRRNKVIIAPAPGGGYAGLELAVYCGQLADKVIKTAPNATMPVPTEFMPFIKFWSISLGWMKRHKTGRFNSNYAIAMMQLKELKKNSTEIHREAPIRFMTEKELKALGYNNIRSDERQFPE